MEVAVRSDTQVARPLRVLVPLIKQDFEAAEKAGMAYYKAAGDKLNEALEGHFDGRPRSDFYEWAEKTFGKKPTQIRTWMASAAASADKPLKSLREASGHKPPPTGPGSRIHREWTAPIDAVADKTRREQLRFQREDELSKREERKAIDQLKLRVIEIGYKVLAKELHPDKGGTEEAFSRLKQAVDEMKRSI